MAKVDMRKKENRDRASYNAGVIDGMRAGYKFHYEYDGYLGAYRVWRTDHPGDVFDVIVSPEGSGPLFEFFKKHPGLFIEGMPEDDED